MDTMDVYEVTLGLFALQLHDWSIAKMKIPRPEYRLLVASCSVMNGRVIMALDRPLLKSTRHCHANSATQRKTSTQLTSMLSIHNLSENI